MNPGPTRGRLNGLWNSLIRLIHAAIGDVHQGHVPSQRFGQNRCGPVIITFDMLDFHASRPFLSITNHIISQSMTGSLALCSRSRFRRGPERSNGQGLLPVCRHHLWPTNPGAQRCQTKRLILGIKQSGISRLAGALPNKLHELADTILTCRIINPIA